MELNAANELAIELGTSEHRHGRTPVVVMIAEESTGRVIGYNVQFRADGRESATERDHGFTFTPVESVSAEIIALKHANGEYVAGFSEFTGLPRYTPAQSKRARYTIEMAE